MPDPHVVYIVTAVVVLGLVAWVVVVLSRSPSSKAAPPSPGANADAPHALDAHLEIRDAPTASGSNGDDAAGPKT